MANNSNSPGPAVVLSPSLMLDAVSRVGVPFVILLIFLTQLSPKIDRGLEIADHVDAELQYLAAHGCAPPHPTSVLVSRSP